MCMLYINCIASQLGSELLHSSCTRPNKLLPLQIIAIYYPHNFSTFDAQLCITGLQYVRMTKDKHNFMNFT